MPYEAVGRHRTAREHTRAGAPLNADVVARGVHKRHSEHSLISDIKVSLAERVLAGAGSGSAAERAAKAVTSFDAIEEMMNLGYLGNSVAALIYAMPYLMSNTPAEVVARACKLYCKAGNPSLGKSHGFFKQKCESIRL